MLCCSTGSFSFVQSYKIGAQKASNFSAFKDSRVCLSMKTQPCFFVFWNYLVCKYTLPSRIFTYCVCPTSIGHAHSRLSKT